MRNRVCVCISKTRKNLYNITENGKTIKFSILNEKKIETKIKYMEIVNLTTAEKRGKFFMFLGGMVLSDDDYCI